MRTGKQLNSADVLDQAMADLKKSQQKVNREMSRAARTKRRVSQRAGGMILEVPVAIRARVLRVFDAVVDDAKKLEACESLFRALDDGEDLDVILRSAKPFRAAAAE